MVTSSSLLVIEPTALPGVLLISPKRFGDHRGWFCETWNANRLKEQGIDLSFVQDNQSFSAQKGTLRGLHFQIPPFAQDKLIRVLKGRILDIAVDLRHSSPTYGQHCAIELSAENGKQLLVPKGFAHGFVTLEPNVEIFYKVTAPYSPEHDKGLIFDDPDLNIDWRFPHQDLELSDKDYLHPKFKDLPQWFD